ncbi:MAG: metal ABC transporter permease [Bauldia sp.]
MAAFDELLASFALSQPTARALLATLCLSLAGTPIGVFLTLRRMSLAGDAMSHAILPGVAIAFLAVGQSPIAMAIGGAAAGIVVALASSFVSRRTPIREDASLAAVYLISLALGVALVSLRGTSLDLDHILFGDAFAIAPESLALIVGIAAVTLLALPLLFRALVIESADPLFFRSVSRRGPAVQAAFLVLMVVNLVAGYQALGTLLAIGLMVLPAAIARLWTDRIRTLMLLAPAIGMAASLVGLLTADRLGLEPGPAVILAAGIVYAASLLATRLTARTGVRRAPAMR